MELRLIYIWWVRAIYSLMLLTKFSVLAALFCRAGNLICRISSCSDSLKHGNTSIASCLTGNAPRSYLRFSLLVKSLAELWWPGLAGSHPTLTAGEHGRAGPIRAEPHDGTLLPSSRPLPLRRVQQAPSPVSMFIYCLSGAPWEGDTHALKTTR